jgi:hypothetical protein
MWATVIEEPELEFGAGGRHIDPRFGVANFGPVDAGSEFAPDRIRVGLIGPQKAVEGIRSWLQHCREPIKAKPARHAGQAALFPSFPGFNGDETYRSTLAFEERNMRVIPAAKVKRLAHVDMRTAVRDAIDLYLQEIDWLADGNRVDVILCARPAELDVHEPDEDDDGDDTGVTERQPGEALRPDFHDQLKAAALGYQPPLQIIRPETWDRHYKPPEHVRRDSTVQDEATRAWNLHTALYYKAGGAPWRLIRRVSDYTTCYVGISFFHAADGSSVNTSVAQLFNERGDGVVVKGGPAAVTKDDRRPYLTEDAAEGLLTNVLAAYRQEHSQFPARLVVHKTSGFADTEQIGLHRAAEAAHIDMVELMWVQHERRYPIRVFRPGEHPPLRGTFLTTGDRNVLYTRGSVDFYTTYPGMYVPSPLSLRPLHVDHAPEALAAETLALTKLNWNQTQLDGMEPITLRAANKTRHILKHIPPGGSVARRYAYYM